MGRVVVAVVTGCLLMAVCLGGCVTLLGESDPGSSSSTAGATGSRPDGGGPAIPVAWELLDQQASGLCSDLSWSVLAAIGRVESNSGQSNAPGVWSGANSAGAEGPMQFEPATFAAYATVGPGGAQPPTPYDPVDAVYTAARLLCADGAGSASTLATAIADYNHSQTYVNTVLVLAQALVINPDLDAEPAGALEFSAAQLGTPYRWGGTGNGGFDCSGLVQAAYSSAGVSLPRVAQDQFDYGPTVPDGTSVEPGDLIFFGNSVSEVEHVGIYVGYGEMIDAPHTGANVREEPANLPNFVGATRPA